MYQEYLNQLQSSLVPLSSDELKSLLNDDDKLNDQVEDALKSLIATKDQLLTDNRFKAEQNIEQEPKIIELRGKVLELVTEGKELAKVVQSQIAEVKTKSGSFSQETALALLQTAAAESEEESEQFVKQLKDGDINIETFLEQFLVARKTMHLRKFKAEKMQELMRNPSGANSQPIYGNLPSNFFSSPQSSGVPYPLAPVMPMPLSRPY